jgi:hypothetical protein
MDIKPTKRTDNKPQEQLEAAVLATRANERDPFPLREPKDKPLQEKAINA